MMPTVIGRNWHDDIPEPTPADKPAVQALAERIRKTAVEGGLPSYVRTKAFAWDAARAVAAGREVPRWLDKFVKEWKASH